MSRYLQDSGVSYELRVLDQSTRTSALAARALGCPVSEIAKSVVFVGSSTTVVVISGDKRVDVGKLSRIVGGHVKSGTPEEVEASTGYSIGGVPPFPHRGEVQVMVDRSITEHELVWAAAGAPNAVFQMGSVDLARLAGGVVKDLSA